MHVPTSQHLVTRILLFAILSLVFASSHAQPVIALTAPEKAYVQDISILVLKNAYNRLGFSVEIHRLPNVRSLVSANIGQFDGEVSRIAGLDTKYANLNAVPTPVNSINVIALGNQNSKRINSLHEIESDVVCVKGIKLVEKLIETYNIQCSFVVDIYQALMMVMLERAQYTLLPETSARVTLLNEPKIKVEVVSPVLHSEKLYHYLHQKHIDLIQPLSDVLSEMQKSGEIDQIRSRFLELKL